MGAKEAQRCPVCGHLGKRLASPQSDGARDHVRVGPRILREQLRCLHLLNHVDRLLLLSVRWTGASASKSNAAGVTGVRPHPHRAIGGGLEGSAGTLGAEAGASGVRHGTELADAALRCETPGQTHENGTHKCRRSGWESYARG